MVTTLLAYTRAHADTNTSKINVTRLDPFHYLSQTCWINEVEPCEDVAPLESQKSSASDIKLAFAGDQNDSDQHSTITVKTYPPAGKDEDSDIISFEAWKEIQFQKAVEADLVLDMNEQVEEDVLDLSVQGDRNTSRSETESVNKSDSADQKNGQVVREGPFKDEMQKTEPQKGRKSAVNIPNRYNYASPDCSARVISSSPQSQHASSVLHKSKDRYMLTPCNAKEHWVVIELCDEIRVEAIEIGMYEFFSGVLKEINLSVDATEDEYDDQGQGKEWQTLETFHAKNARGAQVFNLPNPTSFHRFIRLDFPSYYGKEYYCPISSVKVYGMNQMEAFKWESKRIKQLEEEWKQKQSVDSRRRQLPPPPVKEEHLNEETGTLSQSPLIAASSLHSSEDMRPRSASLTTFETSTTTTAFKAPTLSAVSSPSLHTIASSRAVNETSSASFPSVHVTSTTNDTFETPVASSTPDQTEPPEINSNIAASTQTSVNATEPAGTLTSKSLAVTSTQSIIPPVASSINSINSSTTSNNNPPPPKQNIKADSTESIYAFIVRRLNALEGNATLGMMYVEEQSKVSRQLFNKLESSWKEYKHDQALHQQLSFEKERMATQDAFRQMLVKMDQRDQLVAETVSSLRLEIETLTEEMAWEKRRGVAQLTLLLTVVVVAALSRSATIDVRTVRPLLEARKSLAAAGAQNDTARPQGLPNPNEPSRPGDRELSLILSCSSSLL